MELSSKQRAYLRSLSNDLDVIVHIGKDGIGDNLVKQANDALEARELIKCRVLENSMLTAREACDELSALTRSEPGAGHRHEIRALPPLAQKGQEGQDRAAQGSEEDRVKEKKRSNKLEDRNLRRQLQPVASGSYGRGRERGKIFRARRAPAHPGGYPARTRCSPPTRRGRTTALR